MEGTYALEKAKGHSLNFYNKPLQRTVLLPDRIESTLKY